PNKAIVEVEVRATAENASTARSRVARNVTAVREALLALGLEESQVTTADFDIYRRVERERRGDEVKERVVSHARHELRVELDSVDDAGQVIDTAVDSGATSIGDVRFTVTRATRQELRQEALEDAMENARADAETLAAGANLTITGVDVVTTNTGREVRHRAAFEATPAADAGGGTSVEAGPVTVTATVSVSYNATAGG
ncbi:MAG: SIMPL domain-containing protein, partial [Halobacteriales archaeon]